MLPSYFKNLHIGICAITGQPRIISSKSDKPSFCDKYKDIPQGEWISAVLNYFDMLAGDIKPPQKYHLPILKASIKKVKEGEGLFVLGGKFDTWEDLESQAKAFLAQVQYYKEHRNQLEKESKKNEK